MPNPWKKAKISSGLSRLVSNIRSKQRGGSSPLVVQTGFPTSLADLVVKNRSRLKKPSSSRNKHQQQHHHHQQSCPPCESLACRVSEIIAAVQSPSPDGIPVSDRSEESIDLVAGGSPGFDGIGEEKNDFSGSDGVGEEKSNLSGLDDRIGEEKTDFAEAPRIKGMPFPVPWSRGVGFQAKVVLVMTLAVCTKELVVAIMVSAFSLLLLEYVGGRLVGKRSSGSVDKGGNLADGFLMIENDSEVKIKQNGNSYSSSFCPEASMPFERQGVVAEAVSPERKDLSPAIEPSPVNLRTEAVAGKVRKKHWSKIVAGKFRAAKRVKDAKQLRSDSNSRCALDRSEGEGRTEESGDGVEETCNCNGDNDDDNEDDDEEALISSKSSNESIDDVVVEGAPLSEGNTGDRKSSDWKHLVLIIIVLSGLVGGRLIALGLTVAWCYLVKFTGTLLMNWKIRRSGSSSVL